ncbi:methyltransferase type 12 [Phycicoccus sp. Root563]|uniref:DinB family protein n=1 Tax=Phycicoccus sp. Root563 TaxID=1736562 RepID=UPI0007034CB7|nr:DinB family protein [Phycicoccus sp. Root563]KQZ91076.1 methyltransferase type 12 [Phycicoccus sp. Root563]
MGAADDAVEPDTKDWTWTLERACPECGFEAAAVAAESVAGLTVELTMPWQQVLARDDVANRPGPGVWSPLEYACHVRDVCRVFGGRVRLMLDEDEPTFPNWDQDETALEEGYGAQDPLLVGRQLAEAADAVAASFAGVEGDQWARRGLRSNGSAFTVESLGRYFLHDLAHHLVDVGAVRPWSGDR